MEIQSRTLEGKSEILQQSPRPLVELWEENTDTLVVSESEGKNGDLSSEEDERLDFLNLDGLNNFPTEQEPNQPIPQDIPLLQLISALSNPMEGEQRIQQEQDLPLFQDYQIPQKQNNQIGENQQDPIAWLRDYNAASEANGWNNVQKLQVVPAYLRPTAAEWYQSLKQNNPGFVTTWVA
ncbi:hypothetical protein RhiirC2_784341 [Rhizophagus irregularis]|uniref:Retrotransposon gag domain-containing protein n=1 Tax=Rhizophagus irregularis TaxID=588596 RepID=A0A2N1MYR8_9GLOM|nr:hypothetical protein RhiirC2_784341 [Rhizophagus irregularis]